MLPGGSFSAALAGILTLFAAVGAGYASPRERPERWSAGDELHRLRPLLTERGIKVVPSPLSGSDWEWGLSLVRDGEPGDLRVSEYPSLQAGEGRADLLRGRVSEWLRDGPQGAEYGIEISGPSESGLLHLEFVLSGSLFPKTSQDENRVEFREREGVPVLGFRYLRAADAEGRDVAVRWERIEGRGGLPGDLRLVVHDGGHLLPIRVTTLLAEPEAVSIPAEPAFSAAPGMLIVPSNDTCSGVQVIPGAGPFPCLSSTVDITDATTAGDPGPPSCQPNVSRGVWFSFTPVTTSDYTFSVCSGAPTATTVEDTVLAVYSSAGTCAGLVELAGGCDDDSCSSSAGQSVISNTGLTAGTTYYVVAWQFGNTPPVSGMGSLQLQVIRHPAAGQPPPNDLCGAAEPIPAGGPFPYLTAVTNDISAATTTGDPPPPSCQPNVSRSIWYTFTPSADGRYAFSACADAPTGTTVDDTVLAVYMGDCAALTQVAAGCDDDSCATEPGQSMLQGFDLVAGTTYHIGAWQYGTQSPFPGNTAVQVRVRQVTGPVNDNCVSPAPLALDSPVRGTTVSAVDDTRLPAGSACFSGVGQTPSTAAGADVVYGFTAPAAGSYSFRLNGYETSKNAVLYVASDCPTTAAPAGITGCLGAANRSSVNPEEVTCVPLSAGQTVRVYVDENATTAGSDFTLEASVCAREVEPNDTPDEALEPVCGIEGSIAPAGDADFFALGLPSQGSKVFALVDGAAGNSTDFDLRVTTGADTLEYDDLNNDVPFGAVSPNIAGTPLGAGFSWLRVSHYSPTAQAEPYRLYFAIQPPAGGATPEVEPNNTPATASIGINEYFSGALSDQTDVDHFSFQAAAGESIQIGLDLDPTRDGTPFNGSLALLDSSGAELLSVNDLSQTFSTSPGAGSLTATTPQAPAEGIVYRIRSSGTYHAKVAWSSGTPRDYLVSIAHTCRTGPPTDLAVTQSDSPDPAPAGGQVAYTVVVRNLGINPALVVVVRDDLPAGTTLVSAVPSQGVCVGASPVICHLGTLAAGGLTTVSVTVIAPSTAGPITNLARATSAVIDTTAANDASIGTTMVGSASDIDGDGVADGADCAPTDASAWAVPGEVAALIFPTAGDPSLIQWSPASNPGGTIVRYDLLRSTTANGFPSATCPASNLMATTTIDPAIPGATYFYMVRSENICGGNLGTRSDGTPRVGVSCP